MSHQTASQMSIVHGKNFNTGHYAQSFQPISFTPAMLVGTYNFDHFIPLSVTLALAGDHMVSTKQSTILPSQSYKKRCVACQYSLDVQTLWLQAGAGEGSFIHLLSGPDCVACKRQEEVKEDEHKAKPVGFIFSHTFQLNELKFNMVKEQYMSGDYF